MAEKTRVLLLCFGLPFLCAADSESEWKSYSPPDRSYRITLPGLPAEQDFQHTEGTTHRVTATTGKTLGLSFVVLSRTISESPLSHKDAREYTEGLIEGWLDNSRAKSVSSIPLGLGEVYGRDVVADSVRGKKARTQAYTSGVHSYQLIATSDNLEELHSDDAERFFRSFRILDLSASQETRSAYYFAGRAVGELFVYVLASGSLVIGAVVVLRILWKRQKNQKRA